ncbi:MAG: hypothetical protein R6T85_09565, partial [Egibacteraceae bacterium]
MAYLMAVWSKGAKRKPMPTSRTHCSTTAGGASMFTPSACRTSALPKLLEAPRLPCLATGTPAPAATTAEVVDTLNV